MNQLISDYKKTLKPNETEEIVNLLFFRPTAFLFVLIVKKIDFSPNYFTFTSLIFGLLSGYYLSQGALSLGALFIYLMISFDCSDGQLARLKGISTKYGKMLDNVADIISYLAMLFGIAYYQYYLHSNPYVFSYAGLSFLVLGMNVLFWDQFKNQYIMYVYNDYHDKVDPLSILYRHYSSSRGIKKVANYVYYNIYKFETSITKLGCLSDSKRRPSVFEVEGFKPTKDMQELYKETFTSSIRLWSFIGTSTHFFLVILLAIINRIEMVFAVFIIYSILMCITALIYQNIAYAKFKKKLKSIPV